MIVSSHYGEEKKRIDCQSRCVAKNNCKSRHPSQKMFIEREGFSVRGSVDRLSYLEHNIYTLRMII